MTIEIREIQPQDREWVRSFLMAQAGYLRAVSRGVLHQLDELPGWIGLRDGVAAAVLTYHLANGEIEVVSLFSAQRGLGLGARLLAAARETARELGCRRLWLITTNDNLPAIQFYERRGMKLVAVHRNALAESRKLKPEIPLTGLGGIPIDDEIEFEFALE